MRPACAIMEGERRPAMTETIRSALLLIEAAPDTELTAASLAQALGYSPWHLQRLFARETGTSIAAHVLTRRLERALHAMAMGERGIDAALRWGFDTYAGFYKAFVRHYGCSPRAYLRLYPAPPAGNRMPMNTILTEAELRTLLAAWPQAARLPITLLFSPEGSPRGNVWRVGNDLYLKRGPRPQLLRAALLAHGGAVCGFLDFDLTLRGPRLWDICYLTTGILSEADTSEDSRWLTLLDAVLEGYHAQSPLTPTERQAVWPMLCGITLVCMASFGHDSACQHAAEMNRAMLRSLLSWRTNIEQITHALP